MLRITPSVSSHRTVVSANPAIAAQLTASHIRQANRPDTFLAGFSNEIERVHGQEEYQMVENREFVDNIEARTAHDEVVEPLATRADVIEGLEVRNAHGEFVGGVHAVRATHFQLDRSMARDIWVPYSAVADVADGLVMLNVADVSSQGWEHPPLLGTADP